MRIKKYIRIKGYGSREYDLAWALVLRPGQKFLNTYEERDIFLKSYTRFHKYLKEAFDYYMVLFGILFYRISQGKENIDKENEDYRKNMILMIDDIINHKNCKEFNKLSQNVS